MKRRREYPGATPYTDRHGRRRWRYRKKGFSAELGADYGSDEFVRRYEAAVKELRVAGQAGANRVKPFSVSALVASYYRSPEYLGLSDSTKRVYRGVLEKFRERFADLSARSIEARHIRKLLSEKAETPHAANILRKRLAQLFDHAVMLDWRSDNPVRATKPYKTEQGGFHTWDEGEIARFFEVHQPGTLPHRAMTLMLHTGAARVDAVQLGPWNLKDGKLIYRRQKTKRAGGDPVKIPLHPDLASVLRSLPDDRPFLATRSGKARSAAGLGNAMRKWCDDAGLSACSSHGLRKACARRLAEAGAGSKEIMAVTGHKTLAEVQRYTDAADRSALAESAINRLIARPNGEQTVVNLPERFAKIKDKPLINKGK
jgi:integrase